MSGEQLLRFVGAADTVKEAAPWGMREPLCRPALTDAQQLYLVRVTMGPGQSHAFHRHPELEEIIYVISGTAEQWVDRESRLLSAGELAHVPRDVVHGTYNAGTEPLVFLAILSPAQSEGQATVDVSMEEPWQSLRPGAEG